MAATALDSSVSVGAGGGERCLFSPSASLFGLCRPDGVLLVYDSRVAAVKTDFSPSRHLMAACTALAWRPSVTGKSEREPPSKSSPSKKNRKRKNSLVEVPAATDSSELAVGTAAGSVIIYCAKTAEYKETRVHEEAVNSLVWNSEGTTVYSCSHDGSVGCLLAKKSVVSTFQPEDKKQPLLSLAVTPEGNGLLVGAVTSIFWIDIDTKVTLRSFASHCNGGVTSLSVIAIAPELPLFVLSAGNGDKDRLVSVWRLQEAETKEPDAMLNVNEVVRTISAARTDEGLAVISCVSRSGVLTCFQFDPASKRKKNKVIRPSATIQVATERDPNGKVTSVPILSSHVSADLKIHLVHGTHSKPTFETHEFEKLDKVTCLVRRHDTARPKKDYGINFMDSKKSGVTVLTPGIPEASSAVGKRKQPSGSKLEGLPMIERARLLAKDGDQVTTPPRTDSLLQLLCQGLQNNESQILDAVLDRADEDLIDKTVRKLPVERVFPLVATLQRYIKGRGMVNNSHSKWMRSVLQHHAGFLMSNPECENLLGPVLAMLETRTKHHSALLQLKGKLDIMTRQLTTRPEERAASVEEVNKEALLVYRDDSSDELSDVLDELLLPASDTEEVWNLDDEDASDDETDEDQTDEKSASEDEDEQEDLPNGNHGESGDEDMDSS